MKMRDLLKTAVTNPKEFAVRLYIKVTYRIVRIIDGMRDKRLCGYDLTSKRNTTSILFYICSGLSLRSFSIG